jgi:PIN domain nuclease of toxin-antitoxin system
VNLLLDTHALLWALHDPARLLPAARAAIADARHLVYFSAASAWELELKAAKGKLTLPNGWLEAAEHTGFVELPVSARDASHSARLPWHHSDPFDRLLVAQAQSYGLRLATRDPLLSAYEVPLLAV